MVNGKNIAIIEVKYKAHKDDVDRLVHKKYENFKKLFPEYSNFKHHLALASFKVHDDVIKQARKKKPREGLLFFVLHSGRLCYAVNSLINKIFWLGVSVIALILLVCLTLMMKIKNHLKELGET